MQTIICGTRGMKNGLRIVLSEQNRSNRKEQKLPNCSGRTPAQVVRYKIAQDLGVDSSEVGRGHTFLAMHTHPNKTLQNFGIFVSGIKF
ncbi:hypothetical protein FRX31_002425 [Thalictrum thalictroides]|uniref:Uncharacterized protein n=1 Tax=Thalictrum thalictroides TaxID=46969 RepID=A0A7J6XG28_THATH|nr:hypothetical protein FRX31_002425 [Thalictrum thalictroides]